MEKIFDIVGSLIPDEQKETIRTQIDGAVNDLFKGREKELRKTLSAKYDVDLFEDDISKAYDNGRFVLKDTVKKLRRV